MRQVEVKQGIVRQVGVKQGIMRQVGLCLLYPIHRSIYTHHSILDYTALITPMFPYLPYTDLHIPIILYLPLHAPRSHIYLYYASRSSHINPIQPHHPISNSYSPTFLYLAPQRILHTAIIPNLPRAVPITYSSHIYIYLQYTYL